MTDERKPRLNPLKLVFALEYVLQGLVNPFQGITYQPFFTHLQSLGLDAAAIQTLYARSYLAWAFKPAIGFVMDAYGKTRTALILLLGVAAVGFLVAPLVSGGPRTFFWLMFAVSVVLSATDVAVDRATVIVGADEAAASGRPRATTVGLNQAICWLAVYGTLIVSGLAGGFAAEAPFRPFVASLAVVPLVLLAVVARLPRDRAATIPWRQPLAAFWRGLNSGPVLGVFVFSFVLFFQPSLGPLWNDHLLRGLHFSQRQVGISDSAGYAGYFIGVLLFAWKGVKWQERVGLRRMFAIYIVTSAVLSLSKYMLLDPTFSAITASVHGALPFLGVDVVRVGFLSMCTALVTVNDSLVRMSTFSVAGAVIPVAAAGSLFAGMMSVNNLAYSFSFASGAWLYRHGTEAELLRSVQSSVFGIDAAAGQPLSMQMLIFIGTAAFLVSFAVVRVLPDRRATLAATVETPAVLALDAALPRRLRVAVDVGALALGVATLLVATLRWRFDLVSAFLMSFFGGVVIRRLVVVGLARTVVHKGR